MDQPTYDINKLEKEMYMSKEISINEKNIQDKRLDAEERYNNMDTVIRDCLDNEIDHKKMMNIHILKVGGKDEKRFQFLLDSGANRGLTKYSHLLRGYRRIKKIPVNGISDNGAACYIEGVGYIDLETVDGYSVCHIFSHFVSMRVVCF